MSDIASVEGSGSSRSSEESATSSVLTPTDESDEETGSTSGAAAKELSSPRVSAVDGAGQAGIASLVGSAEDDVADDGSAQGADNEVAVKQRGERRHKKKRSARHRKDAADDGAADGNGDAAEPGAQLLDQKHHRRKKHRKKSDREKRHRQRKDAADDGAAHGTGDAAEPGAQLLDQKHHRRKKHRKKSDREKRHRHRKDAAGDGAAHGNGDAAEPGAQLNALKADAQLEFAVLHKLHIATFGTWFKNKIAGCDDAFAAMLSSCASFDDFVSHRASIEETWCNAEGFDPRELYMEWTHPQHRAKREAALVVFAENYAVLEADMAEGSAGYWWYQSALAILDSRAPDRKRVKLCWRALKARMQRAFDKMEWEAQKALGAEADADDEGGIGSGYGAGNSGAREQGSMGSPGGLTDDGSNGADDGGHLGPPLRPTRSASAAAKLSSKLRQRNCSGRFLTTPKFAPLLLSPMQPADVSIAAALRNVYRVFQPLVDVECSSAESGACAASAAGSSSSSSSSASAPLLPSLVGLRDMCAEEGYTEVEVEWITGFVASVASHFRAMPTVRLQGMLLGGAAAAAQPDSAGGEHQWSGAPSTRLQQPPGSLLSGKKRNSSGAGLFPAASAASKRRRSDLRADGGADRGVSPASVHGTTAAGNDGAR